MPGTKREVYCLRFSIAGWIVGPGAMPILNLRMYDGFDWSLFRTDGIDEAIKGWNKL